MYSNSDEAGTTGAAVANALNEKPQGITAYHGTTHEIDGKLRAHPGARGTAAYFNTSPKEASAYATGDVSNYARFAPSGDHPSVLPVDITGRLFDEASTVPNEDLRRFAGAFNDKQNARYETGKAPKDELFDPEHFSSSYFTSEAHLFSQLSIEELAQQNLAQYPLIINTTPLGMQPNILTAPPLLYAQLTPQQVVYDLVYNPAETRLLALARAQGCTCKNGLEMLHLQADAAWQLWGNFL